MNIRTFFRRCAIRMAIVVAAAIAVLGLCFGKVIEATLAVEIDKVDCHGYYHHLSYRGVCVCAGAVLLLVVYDKKK